MTKRAGREMLVLIGNGADPEVFLLLCGLTAKSVAINATTFDVTTADCISPGGTLWAESRKGVTSMSISGTGFFKDEASEARAVASVAAVDAISVRAVIPGLGRYDGAFHLTGLTFDGPVDGGMTYQVEMTSTGPVAFTAETLSAPANTLVPAVIGLPQAGQTVTAYEGVWADAQTFTYQWQELIGSVWTDISAATGRTLVVPGGVTVGRPLRVQVTASNSAGSTTVASAPSAIVIAA